MHLLLSVILIVLPLDVSSFTSSNLYQSQRTNQETKLNLFGASTPPRKTTEDIRSYPESKPATYDIKPGSFGFGPETIVAPLLKQTQLENRKLKVVYVSAFDMLLLKCQ